MFFATAGTLFNLPIVSLPPQEIKFVPKVITADQAIQLELAYPEVAEPFDLDEAMHNPFTAHPECFIGNDCY